MRLSKEEGIKRVYNCGSHVVLLGAGASIASCIHSAEKNGVQLPSMANLIDVVGLNDIVEDVSEELRSENFEELFSNLHADNPDSPHLQEIEKRVFYYFNKLELPETPTIYDYLVLSLRNKDHIATFNWDPFLYQAFNRNSRFTENLPYMSFLHGCTALGWNSELKRSGPVDAFFDPELTQKAERVKLLYPVGAKNYTDDEFIKTQWEYLTGVFEHKEIARFTAFGYSAPVTDIEAVGLLKTAWGKTDSREMEQFEIIDVEDESVCKKRWNKFIHSHHYDFTNNYFNSILSLYPRRTGERFEHQYNPKSPAETFQENNKIPDNFKTLDEMWSWFEPLIEAEEKSL